jgi:flagellar basal-body rod protein FlgF
MLRGLYTAATGMLTQQRRMDVVTNNLANAATPGFKEDNLLTRSFAEQLIERMDDPAIFNPGDLVGPLGNGIHIDEIAISFAQGPLAETRLQTDIAIGGEAFFVVGTPAGERYTRSGNFKVSSDGFLNTQDGWPVMGQNGHVKVGTGGFSITADGTVRSAAGTDRLRLVGFDDVQGLRKDGTSRYRNYNANLQDATQDIKVSQGWLEQSNVDLSHQVVDMIAIQRSHEINQRIIKIYDEKLGKTVNELGRV